MRICVCVKQVPDTTAIRVDPSTNRLIRDGVPSILNPFDSFALEAAALLKDQDPSIEIIALTLGPAQAEAALRESLAICADAAYLISDPAFGGSDTLATSYILSTAIQAIESKEGPIDAVFCGRQAIDGDTAQVGPAMAEMLGLPQMTNLFTLQLQDGRLQAWQESDEAEQMISAALPCLCTFTKLSSPVRCPTLKRKLAAKKIQISVLSAADLPELQRERVGLSGSPTRVVRTFPLVSTRKSVILPAKTAQEAAEQLLPILTQKA